MFKNLGKWILVSALSAVGCGSSLYGQTTTSADLANKLYSRIAQFTSSGAGTQSGGQRFLILATPGILLDPSLDLTPTSTDYHLLSTILDRAPDASWVYKPKNMTSFDLYSDVLKYHQTPTFQLSDQQKKDLKAAQKILYSNVNSGTPSDEYKQFQAKRTALIYASNAVDMYQTANPKKVVPPDLLAALQNAYDDYNLFGKASEVLTAEATIQQLQGLNPNEWWGELQAKMQANQKLFNATPFGPLAFYPDYPVWFDKTKSWTGTTLTEGQLEQSNSSSHTSVGGGLSASWGLWSVGGSYGQETTRTSSQFTGTNIVVQLEMTQIGLQRSWMDDLVFHSNTWQWGSGAPDCSLISDGGNADQGVTPQGQMPFLITGLLLARNVSLSGSWSADLKTTYDSMTHGGASVGWGPFSFGGSYVSSTHNDYHSAQVSGSTITFAEPQIIGFFVEVLPVSPKPSPTLVFQGAACTSRHIGAMVAGVDAGITPQNLVLNNSFLEMSKMVLDKAKLAKQ
jgi:hypothetical protein